jgi:CHAD domain-containing protein
VTKSLQEDGELQKAIDQLTEVRASVSSSSLQDVNFKTVAGQFSSAVKRGKKAFAAAYSQPTAGNFHDFRKRAKDLRYQLGVLTNLWPDVLEAYASSAKELEQTLGDDHNLAVLADIVKNTKANGKKKQALNKIIRNKQAKLRDKANRLGSRIYSEPVKAWTCRLEASWKTWTAAGQD